MATPTSREIRWLALAALAPIALGYAMHREHVAAFEPAHGVDHGVVVGPATTEVVAVPVPIATEVPVPAPVAEPPTPAEPRAGLAYGDAFSFVISDGRPLLVLSPDPDLTWATTPAAVTYDRWGELHARREVDPEALPAEISARLGSEIDLFTGTERKCTGRIGTPYLYADVSGDWDYADGDGDGDEDDEVDPSSAFKDGRSLLVAPVISDGDCDGARWARNAALRDPRAFTRVERTEYARTKLARRAYFRLPALKQARADFEMFQRDTAEEPDTVEPVPLGRRMTSTGWTDASGELVAVTHWIDGPEFGGCGGVEAQWGFAAVSDDGATVDRVLDGGGTQLVALIDIDGDGSPEALTSPSFGWGSWELLTLTEDGWTAVASMDEMPFFGCPC